MSKPASSVDSKDLVRDVQMELESDTSDDNGIGRVRQILVR